MNEGTVTKAANALAAAANTGMQQAGANVESAVAQRGAGLATGQFSNGGYTYNRIMAPIVPALQASLVTAAKQALFRQAAKNAINNAQVSYDKARARMTDRQEKAKKKQWEQNKARQRQYDAYMSSGGGISGTAPGAGSNGVINKVNLSPVKTNTPAKKVTPGANGVFWRGSNGQVYVKGSKGTNAAGAWDKNTQKYWTSRGFQLINDPVVGNRGAGGGGW